jgi:hypothetical protein
MIEIKWYNGRVSKSGLNIIESIKKVLSKVSTFILHERRELSKCSEVRCIKKGIKISPVCIWMRGHVSVCLCVCLSVCVSVCLSVCTFYSFECKMIVRSLVNTSLAVWKIASIGDLPIQPSSKVVIFYSCNFLSILQKS